VSTSALAVLKILKRFKENARQPFWCRFSDTKRGVKLGHRHGPSGALMRAPDQVFRSHNCLADIDAYMSSQFFTNNSSVSNSKETVVSVRSGGKLI
jgi:hypothetical protein